VQSELLTRLCTVYSVDLDCFWFVYIAQCSLMLLLVCVEFSVQNETLIGVFTVHNAE